MRIAVAGPDGSGKSSICTSLNKELLKSVVIYAGKREFLLTSTEVGLNIWSTLRKFGIVANLFSRFFIYYPLEVLENYVKFNKKIDGKNNYIYERHPIDRVIMKYELKQHFKCGRINTIRYLVEYFLLSLVSLVYVYTFPRQDQVFILLPTSELCFERADGQYKQIGDAHIRIEAYRKAVQEWKQHEEYFTLIEITSDMDVTQIKQIIVDKLQNNLGEMIF